MAEHHAHGGTALCAAGGGTQGAELLKVPSDISILFPGFVLQ